MTGQREEGRKYGKPRIPAIVRYLRAESSRRRPEVLRRLGFLLFLTGALVASGFLLTSARDSLGYAVATGILTSLGASVMFAGLGYLALKAPLADKLALAEVVYELERRDLQGIESIREKYTFDPPFWLGLLGEAKSSLDLLGHALSKWCDTPYKTDFIETLVNVANRGGKVRILMMKAGGDCQKRLKEATGMDHSAKAQKLMAVLSEEVLPRVKKRSLGNITVKTIDILDLPYMMVRTDFHIVVSPYLACTPSQQNPLLVLGDGTMFANTYLNDFEKLFDAGEPSKLFEKPAEEME